MKTKVSITLLLIIILGVLYVYFMDSYPIPEDNLKPLQTVAEFFTKTNLWYIELVNGAYVIKDKNENDVKKSNDIRSIESILIQYHVSSIYGDSDNYVYTKIENSNKIYVFSSE